MPPGDDARTGVHSDADGHALWRLARVAAPFPRTPRPGGAPCVHAGMPRRRAGSEAVKAPHGSRRALLLCALAAAVKVKAATSQPTAPGIGLAALMRALMLPKGSRQPHGWNAFDTLPIGWKTPGAEAASKEDARLGLPLQREGQFLLLQEGRPAYTRDAGGAGVWDLTLLGSGAGFAEVRISMAEMAQAFGRPDAGLDDLKKAGFALRRIFACRPPAWSSTPTLSGVWHCLTSWWPPSSTTSARVGWAPWSA